MARAGFELPNPAFQWAKTIDALDGAAIVIAVTALYMPNIVFQKELYKFESLHEFIQRTCTVFQTVLK
jgi:hypothetical protein